MRAVVAALLFTSLAVGCAGSHSTVRDGSSSAGVRTCGETVLDCLPLGAVELVSAELDAVRAAPSLRALLDGYRPEDPAAFERSFGFTLAAVHRLAYGRYDPGEIWVLEGDFEAAAVVRHVGERMNTLEIVDTAPPRRVGYLGVERVDVAAVGARRIAIASENGTPMMRLLARCGGGDVPAEVDRMPSPLAERLRRAAVGVGMYMPGRFSLDTDAGLLFARTAWVAGTVSEVDAATIELSLRVDGALPASAEANFQALARSVAASEFGGVFGIRDGLGTFRVHAAADGADIAIHLDAAQVGSALRLILGSLEAARSRR